MRFMLPVGTHEVRPASSTGSWCVLEGGVSNTSQGQRAGKQVQLHSHTSDRQTDSLMISTASSTAEMVTQGKLEINSVENVEGKYFLLKCETFSNWERDVMLT